VSQEIVITIEDKNCEQSSQEKIRNRCERCRLREAYYRFHRLGTSHLPEEKLDLCTSCAKRIRFSYQQKDGRKEECAAYIKEKRIESSSCYEMNTQITISSTIDIADEDGKYTLIMADINNLSGLGHKLHGFQQRKLFSDTIRCICEKAVYEAIGVAMRKTSMNQDKKCLEARFEIIAMGGDDIVLIVPGDVALLTSHILAKKIDEFWKEEYEDTCRHLPITNVTISVSAVVADVKMPIALMESIAERNLTQAKQKAHEQKKSMIHMYYLGGDAQLKWGRQDKVAGSDFQLESSSQNKVTGSDLQSESSNQDKAIGSNSQLESSSQDNAVRSDFPMNVEEVETFIKQLDMAKKVSHSRLQNITTAGKQLQPSEWELWLNYQLAKIDENRDQEFINLACDIQENYTSKGKSGISPAWYDLVCWGNQKHFVSPSEGGE
jgi:hypothetical protein